MLPSAFRKLDGIKQLLRPWGEQQSTWKELSQRYSNILSKQEIAKNYTLHMPYACRTPAGILPHHVRGWASLVEMSCTAMQASSQLYMDAINILADQDEGKEALSGDLFRQAIGMHRPPAPCMPDCTVMLYSQALSLLCKTPPKQVV